MTNHHPAFGLPLLVLTSCLLLALGTSGCAIGHEHEYRARFPSAMKGTGRVALAVHDRRPEVLSGFEDDDYVGNQRGRYGEPFDVTTVSDRPLAEDWAASVRSLLQQGGFTVEVVPTRPQEAPALVLRKLAATHAPVTLLLVIERWDTDAYIEATLRRDVTLGVRSASGVVLAMARAAGDVALGGDEDAPFAHTAHAAQQEYEKSLRALLLDGAVQAALAQREGAPPDK